MTEHSPITYKSEVDGNIPPVSPFYGKADSRPIMEILSSIGLEIFGDSLMTLETLRTRMEIEDKAVISSKKTGKTFVDLDKRNCNRLTFGNPLMESMKDQIMQILCENSVKLPVDPNDIELEMSHGDILSYTDGGFFDYHRDGDIRPEHASGASRDQIDQYSMILCLDSGNEDRFDSLSGCTSVYLPSKNLLIFEQELGGALKHNKKVPMDLHTYPQSRMKNHFVVFPSNALHKSHPINEGDFKLALKVDLFIKRPKLTLEDAELHIKRNYYCSCLNCFPHIYTTETKHMIVPSNSKDKLERGFLDLRNRMSQCKCHERCCESCCNCTCAKCIDSNIETTLMCELCEHECDNYWSYGDASSHGDDDEHYDEHYEHYEHYEHDEHDKWDQDYYSEDSFCNGYDRDSW